MHFHWLQPKWFVYDSDAHLLRATDLHFAQSCKIICRTIYTCGVGAIARRCACTVMYFRSMFCGPKHFTIQLKRFSSDTMAITSLFLSLWQQPHSQLWNCLHRNNIVISLELLYRFEQFIVWEFIFGTELFRVRHIFFSYLSTLFGCNTISIWIPSNNSVQYVRSNTAQQQISESNSPKKPNVCI